MAFYLICVGLHILAVGLWIGHMIFWTLIIGPATKRLEPPENREIVRAVSIRKGGLGWPSLAVLILTGVYLLYYNGVTLGVMISGDFLGTRFGQILSLKILLVIGMIVYQARVGHRSSPLLIYADMLAAFLIIALSVLLVRGVEVGSPNWRFHYPTPFLEQTPADGIARSMDGAPLESSERGDSPERKLTASR